MGMGWAVVWLIYIELKSLGLGRRSYVEWMRGAAGGYGGWGELVELGDGGSCEVRLMLSWYGIGMFVGWYGLTGLVEMHGCWEVVELESQPEGPILAEIAQDVY